MDYGMETIILHTCMLLDYGMDYGMCIDYGMETIMGWRPYGMETIILDHYIRPYGMETIILHTCMLLQGPESVCVGMGRGLG